MDSAVMVECRARETNGQENPSEGQQFNTGDVCNDESNAFKRDVESGCGANPRAP